MKTNKQTNCESNENPYAALLVANDNTIHIHIHTRASLKPIKGSRRLLLLHLFSSCFGHRIARTSNGSLYTIVPLCSERRDATRRRFSFSFHHRPSAEMMMMMMMMIAPFPFLFLSSPPTAITLQTHTHAQEQLAETPSYPLLLQSVDVVDVASKLQHHHHYHHHCHPG